MKIQKLYLKNFKRFTELTIDKIPIDTKLVLLIGSNGSGKSSLFDAFSYLEKMLYRSAPLFRDSNYFIKKVGQNIEILISSDLGEIDIGKEYANYDFNDEISKKFFGRSSIRIVPHLTNQGSFNAIITNEDSPASYIQNDTRFINDVFAYIAEIDKALREPVFSGRSADTLKIFQEFIQPLNNSLIKIFGEDEKSTIQIAEFKNATPSEPAQLIFKKGESKINYDLLSHGEKQVVILLINFIVRKKYYEDAIIFIDEMDCHLNTSLQFNLLKEITEVWIPENSQLWTASHALGFIDYSHKTTNAQIIDFDLLNFDFPQTLYPQPKENLEIYEIAIPKNILFDLLKGKKLIVCENKNDEYYNLLNIENTVFVGRKDSRDVFLHIKADNRYFSLRDRDFISDEEIKRIKEKYPNHKILKYYDFENYIYHPDNIAEISPEGFDKNEYQNEILVQKNEKIFDILTSVDSSRQTYEEFKTNPNLKDKDTKSIVDDFKSDDFELFYKFFDMKDKFNKSNLAKYNLSKERLVSTKWFKSKILEILSEK